MALSKSHLLAPVTTPSDRNNRERISTTPFLLWHFSPGDKIENCSAQFLAVCWIAHVEFKVRRLRDRFSVRNALLLEISVFGRVLKGGKALWRVGRRKQKAQWRGRSA